jgi:hypothetical protein
MTLQKQKRRAAIAAMEKIKHVIKSWNKDHCEEEIEPQRTFGQVHKRMMKSKKTTENARKQPNKIFLRRAFAEEEVLHQRSTETLEDYHQRIEHLRRRKARSVHSSNKLELSRIMRYKLTNLSPSDPKYSPIRCVQLSFKDEHVKIVKSTHYVRGKPPQVQLFH